MNSRDFCFWLQGLFELSSPESLDRSQVDCIKQHLGLVFRHDIGTDGKCDHPAPRPQTSIQQGSVSAQPLESIWIC